MSETVVTAEDLRAEAAECLKSSQGNGGMNAAFYAMHIMLSALATRVEARASQGKAP